MSLNDQVNIRQLELTDLNFILASSIKCLTQYTDSIYKGWDKKDLYKHLEKVILFGLSKCNYSVFIACDVKDSDHIIGYIVGNHESNHIFLQYTKYSYRKLGIQKHLLLPLLVDYANPITVNWATKEMKKAVKIGKISIQDKFTEELMQKVSHEG